MADQQATLKLGDHEVRYEAEREAVEAQLELLVGRLLENATSDFQVGITGRSPQAPTPSPPATAPGLPATPEAVPEARRLKQLYTLGKDGRLQLRKLPGRTADTLLLVLYGLLKLQSRKSVHAPGMTSAARASGARFERADRLLAGYEDLVEGFGKRRGKQYRLTADCREHCRRLVESLVGPIAPGGVEDPEGEDERAASREARIPEKVTKRWAGELLTVAQAAERLGIGEAEVGKLRRRWELLGLPAATANGGSTSIRRSRSTPSSAGSSRRWGRSTSSPAAATPPGASPDGGARSSLTSTGDPSISSQRRESTTSCKRPGTASYPPNEAEGTRKDHPESIGTRKNSRPGCFISPARSAASSPRPQKKSTRSAPRMAPPVS